MRGSISSVTPTTSVRTHLLRGAPPLAPARGIPNLPRFACADLRCAPPFPLTLSLRSKGGYTPPLALATPRLRQEAFGMYVTCHCQKGKSKDGGSNNMSSDKAQELTAKINESIATLCAE